VHKTREHGRGEGLRAPSGQWLRVWVPAAGAGVQPDSSFCLLALRLVTLYVPVLLSQR